MNDTKPNIWIYPCLFSAASVGAVLFSPLLPSIQNQFNLSSDAVQLLLSLYLVGFAVSQIFYTLPAKRFGKKRMIIAALSLGLFGNLIVTMGAYSQLFSVILVGRILCALGAGGTLGLGMGLVLDFHTPKEGVQILSLGVTSFGVFPSVATFFTGFLVPFSWIWPLHLLSLYFVFLLLFVQSIPSVEEGRKKVSLSEFVSVIWQHITQGSFLVYCFIWGTNTAAIYLYVTYSSLMAVNLWGLGIRTFSMVLSCVPLAMVLGMLLNRIFGQRIGRRGMLRIGILLEVGCIGIVTYALQMDDVLRTVLFFSGIAGVYLCTPIVTSNATSLGLEQSCDRSVGSGFMGFVNLCITTSVLFIVRALPTDGELVFDKAFIVLGLLFLLLLVLQEILCFSSKTE